MPRPGDPAARAEWVQEAALVRDLDQIDLDLARTLPATGHFADDGPLHAPLRRVLDAHTVRSHGLSRARRAQQQQQQPTAETGYVQGMSLLAGMLLLHLSEEAAFACLPALLARGHLPDFLALDPLRLQAYSRAFSVFLARHLPRLAARLRLMSIDPIFFLLPWWLTILAGAAPLGVAARVWDRWLLDGTGALVSATLALLAAASDGTKLNTAGFEETMEVLTRLDRAEALAHEEAHEAVAHVASVAMRVTTAEFQDVLAFEHAEMASGRRGARTAVVGGQGRSERGEGEIVSGEIVVGRVGPGGVATRVGLRVELRDESVSQGEGVVTRGAEGLGTATVVWDSGVVQVCYVGKGGGYWLKLCKRGGE